MLPYGRKYIFSIPNWTGKSKKFQRASVSSFLKWSNPFGLKKDDQLEQTTALKQGTPGTSEYYVPRKFVPMTRKALIRRIVEDENLINSNDRSYFQNLAVNLDNAIAGTFHGVLGELKVSHRCCHHPQENQKQRYVVINGSLNLGS